MNIFDVYEALSKTGDKLAEEESHNFSQGYNACLFLLKRAIKDSIKNPKYFELFYENNKLRAENTRIKQNFHYIKDLNKISEFVDNSTGTNIITVHKPLNKIAKFNTNASKDIVLSKLHAIKSSLMQVDTRSANRDRFVIHQLKIDLRKENYIIESIKS